MATPEEAQAFATQQRQLIDAADRALAVWLAANVDATPDQVVQAMLTLVGQFARVTAEHAVAWYTLLRERAADRAPEGEAGRFGAPGLPNFAPQPIDAFDAGSIARDTLWALQQQDPAASLAQVADQHIAQAGKDTIAVNAEQDPARPRWARMPVGVTCAWCLMLASRGAAYASRRAAEYAADGTKYHADDDCTPVPVWDDRDLPYDADALYQVYLDARAQVGGDPNRIAAQIRRDHWDTVTDGVPPKDPPDEFYLNRTLHPEYWNRREAAVGVDFKGDTPKPIEILSVENLVARDVDIDWIRNDPAVLSGDMNLPDFGATNVELKSLLPSTPADFKHIRRAISRAPRKDTFLIDISPRTLADVDRGELVRFMGDERSGVPIHRLWILSADGLEEITRT